MATRFYLSTATSTYAPTAGTKSTTLPSGTNNSPAPAESRSLAIVNPNSTNTDTINSLAQTAAQSGYFARFTSDRIVAQTVSANTWTFVLDTAEGNNNANAFLAVCMYVWRPSNSSVVGYLYNSASAIGAEWSGSLGPITYSVSGGAVTAALGDVIVIEAWYIATQAMATSYANQIRYGTSTQYLETPQNLDFFYPARYFFVT